MNKRIAGTIAALWPSWKFSPEMLRLWSLLLDGIPDEEILCAVLEHAQASPWPPTVADILAAVDHPQGIEPTEGWAQLEQYRAWVADNGSAPRPELAPVVRSTAEAVMGPRWQYAQDWAAQRATNRARVLEALARRNELKTLARRRNRAQIILRSQEPWLLGPG